jgi:hypothetical protein
VKNGLYNTWNIKQNNKCEANLRQIFRICITFGTEYSISLFRFCLQFSFSFLFFFNLSFAIIFGRSQIYESTIDMYNETRNLLYVDFAIQKGIKTVSLASKSLTYGDACLVIRMQHNKKFFLVHYITEDPVMNQTVYCVRKSVGPVISSKHADRR